MHWWHYQDGRYIQRATPLEALSRVLYADGFFTTARLNAGCIWLKTHHNDRLKHTAAALGFDPVDEDALSYGALEGFGSGILKLVVVRKTQEVLGYGALDGAHHVLAHFTPCDWSNASYTLLGTSVYCTSSRRACILKTQLTPSSLSAYKTLARTQNVLARCELIQSGYEEGILLDETGLVASATMGNVCYRLGNVWHTPSIKTGAIAGVCRAHLLAHGVKIQDIDAKGLMQADAVYVVNAVRGLMPILEIEG